MLAKVYSAAVQGVDGYEIEIEVNAGGGNNHVIVIVGLPDTAVKESKDRVTTAIQNSGFRWPKGRITINLAPADIKKEGPSFDLPIALGLIAADRQMQGIEPEVLSDYAFVGELALTGKLRPVKGILPIALEARRSRKKALFVPEENAREASVVEGLTVYGASNLRDLCEALAGNGSLRPTHGSLEEFLGADFDADADFSDVRGQDHAKRAIEVAAAGGHNLLFLGPPGSGKSMLSKRIPGILPPMSLDEAIETTKIHSICGLLDSGHAFVARRPFRSPHHTISDVGLLGGSANPTPGEISLANHGVLFLDELPEFKRQTLEVMRQPLEDGTVVISRAAGSMRFPAKFMLVAAMNPCPCGYYGDLKRECRCGANQILRYRQRISGPLLDRIDLHVEVPAVGFEDMQRTTPTESSSHIRERVAAARTIQNLRFAAKPGTVRTNARMSNREMKVHCTLDSDSRGLLKMAMEEFGLSARAHDRILRVSRTIADLAGSEPVTATHLQEAIGYRNLDRAMWT